MLEPNIRSWANTHQTHRTQDQNKHKRPASSVRSVWKFYNYVVLYSTHTQVVHVRCSTRKCDALYFIEMVYDNANMAPLPTNGNEMFYDQPTAYNSINKITFLLSTQPNYGMSNRIGGVLISTSKKLSSQASNNDCVDRVTPTWRCC